ncbi:MAG TPA: hypothetical protein VGO47_05930 [Chlamydiales bacterium]|nr:hypothetical protein [Chlamydiales bacterium]
MCVGELEGTLIRAFCRASNLRAILVGSEMPSSLDRFQQEFERRYDVFGRSMLLQDVVSIHAGGACFNSPGRDSLLIKPRSELDLDVLQLLVQYLNRKYGLHDHFVLHNIDHKDDCIELLPSAWALSRCQYQGIWYVTARPGGHGKIKPFIPHRDSCVVIKTATSFRSYMITGMFAYEHDNPDGKEVFEIYIIV